MASPALLYGLSAMAEVTSYTHLKNALKVATAPEQCQDDDRQRQADEPCHEPVLNFAGSVGRFAES
jgi:hypothetical protein